jgi:hypothetical protein
MKICNEWKQGPGRTSSILFITKNFWQFRIGTGQIALWKPDYTPVFNRIFGAARRAMGA